MLKKNKIALVAASFKVGGVERVLITLANKFFELGYDVDFLVYHDIGPFKQILEPRIRKIVISNDLPGKNNLFRFFNASKQLLKYLRKERDVILFVSNRSLCLNVAPIWFLSGRRAKLFLCEVETIIEEIINSSFKEIAKFALLKYFYRSCSGLIANSMATKYDLIKFCGVSPSKIKAIYNPIPMQKNDVQIKKSTGKILLGVGRLVKNKNFIDLIEVFPRVKSFYPCAKLIILGDGPERCNLEKRVKELKMEKSILFEGFVKDPTPFYLKANVLVQTSLWEGFGNVLIEAMACGTPVVAYNGKGAIREILLDGKYGKLVEVGNLQALGGAIIEQIENSTPREILEESVARFNVDLIAQEYLCWFKDQSDKLSD